MVVFPLVPAMRIEPRLKPEARSEIRPGASRNATSPGADVPPPQSETPAGDAGQSAGGDCQARCNPQVLTLKNVIQNIIQRASWRLQCDSGDGSSPSRERLRVPVTNDAATLARLSPYMLYTSRIDEAREDRPTEVDLLQPAWKPDLRRLFKSHNG